MSKKEKLNTVLSFKDINTKIVNTLGKSLDIHIAQKTNFHKKGLPFYTCISGNEWIKEFPSGRITLVRCEFNTETFDIKETFIRKIK
ncbi:MAG: hypothetical protein KF862_05180 [Chitinophagaceae bacterium]|nr:hypothetical protein [Chitinophagaceae bacterium]